MSEEQENDGTWSGLKKTIIGTIATAVTAGGAYFTSQLFSGDDDEGTKTEQVVQPQAPVINLSVDNSSQNNSSNNGGGTTTIIREVEKPAAQPAAPQPKKEEDSW